MALRQPLERGLEAKLAPQRTRRQHHAPIPRAERIDILAPDDDVRGVARCDTLAVGHGTGAEIRQPLGYAIVGGLLVSQFLTLYTTPVVYLALDRLRRKPIAAPCPVLTDLPAAAE
jgi:hypothetical protein